MAHDKEYQDFYIEDEDGDIVEVTFMSDKVCLTTGDNDYSVFISEKDISSLEKIIKYLKTQ